MSDDNKRRQKGAPAPQDGAPAPESSPSGAPEAAAPEEDTAEAAPDDRPQRDFPVVGIGASAGGLQAVEAFLAAMPADRETGMAFVLVQHLSPDHKSMLRDLVKRYTRMQVFEVVDGMAVEPDCAYIIPPNRDMVFADGKLRLSEPSEPRGLRLPIDTFFRSLARTQHDASICIVLSGTGSDGTLGARAIKAEGGLVMAQEPDSTAHAGMPRSVIATGLVDYVLPPEQMPAQLLTYVNHAVARPAAKPGGEDHLNRICATLRDHTGHDFSQYKRSTLSRRVERRMALRQTERLEDYLRFLRENPGEIDVLFRDLLIGVTAFFRDPEAFEALRKHVVPGLFAGKQPGATVRAWVCGCSTGEEAYSLAMLLQEHVDTLNQSYGVQVFATDIDHRSIEQARAGVFPASIAADVSAERLARFFTPSADGSSFRIKKSLRDLLVFSEQDVIRDPPFSKLDLITCRNLLIYLDGNLQRTLIPLFQYALRPNGVLMLGPSETVGEFTDLFSAVDRKWKIYRCRDGVADVTRPALAEIRARGRGQPARALLHRAPEQHQGRRRLGEIAGQALIAHYAPTAALVTGRGEILHIIGRTGKYLEPAAGDAAMNILGMAREGLRRELTTALHGAVARKEPVAYAGLRVRSNGEFMTANLVVRPVVDGKGGELDLYLVVLEEGAPPARADREGAASSPLEDEDRRIASLENELRAKEEYLQTTMEEMETTNEELKSSNEEAQSINEELQSTNEELETSKEELQSVNEELSTVNAELQDKVGELSRANNDMNNLLAGTGVGTLFVDHELRIARFTPSITQVINLIQGDVGRPVAHIVSNLVGYDRLVEDVQAVLQSLVPREAEVQTREGSWHLMRIRPYRTLENVIEGVVITFIDIHERKRIEQSLRAAEARFQTVLSQVSAGVGQLDRDGRYVLANDQLCETLGYSRQELLSMSFRDVSHAADLPSHLALFEKLVAGGPDFQIEKRYVRKDRAEVWVTERVSAIHRNDGAVESIVAVTIDISSARSLTAASDAPLVRADGDGDAMKQLHRLSTLRIEPRSIDEVLRQLVDAAVVLGKADRGSLHLWDESSGRLRLLAQRGFSRSWSDSWSDGKDADGTCMDVVRRGARLIIEDIDLGPNPHGLHRAAGVRAMQTTPLVDRAGTTVGLLSTYQDAPHRPGHRELDLLDLLARQAAEIVAHGRLTGVLGNG